MVGRITGVPAPWVHRLAICRTCDGILFISPLLSRHWRGTEFHGRRPVHVGGGGGGCGIMELGPQQEPQRSQVVRGRRSTSKCIWREQKIAISVFMRPCRGNNAAAVRRRRTGYTAGSLFGRAVVTRAGSERPLRTRSAVERTVSTVRMGYRLQAQCRVAAARPGFPGPCYREGASNMMNTSSLLLCKSRGADGGHGNKKKN
eukprot:COSAG01_NODE_4816_length_4724_cov_114.090595_2_plen_202_part_00